MENRHDWEVKKFVTEEYFKNDDNLRALFEDYIKLNSFHEMVEEVLRKTVENLLAGDGIDRPAKAWAAARRSFPELRMIRMLSLADDESIDRFCEYKTCLTCRAWT
ncbi:MAG: hypothetical protein DRG59_11590 [Deltaproteobacteria bacterium]|nr:MAG: hypothetical protein DRG59_11590 [Deltaproteobacteria bacterium]